MSSLRLLFVLTLKPHLQEICQSCRVLRFPLPRFDTISVTAQADDVALFVHDAYSINGVFQLLRDMAKRQRPSSIPRRQPF